MELLSHTPFHWTVEIEDEKLEKRPQIISILTTRLQESDMDHKNPYLNLMYYVVLAYEYELDGSTENALKMLKDGENVLIMYLANPDNDPSLCPAFQCILTSTETYLHYHHMKDEDAAIYKKMLSKTLTINKMDNANKAALLFGFPALFYKKYSNSSSNLKRVENLLSKAIETNPNELLWHFLKEKYLPLDLRFKGVCFHKSKEQQHLLRLMQILRCTKDKRNHAWVVHTADTYRKFAKLCRRNKEEFNKLNEESWKLYKESMELGSKYAETLFSCARGFLLLPGKFCNKPLAKKLLDKGFAMNPRNSFGHHVMAQYYEKTNELEQAIQYLEFCAKKKKFAASLDLFRLRYKLGDRNFVAEGLKNLFNDYSSDSERLRILCELLAYYLFVEKNLQNACEYADQIMEFGDIGNSYLKRRPYENIFNRGWVDGKTVSFFNELEKRIHQNEITCSLENREYYDQYLVKLSLRKISTAHSAVSRSSTSSNDSSLAAGFLKKPLQTKSNWRTRTETAAESDMKLRWRNKSLGPKHATRTILNKYPDSFPATNQSTYQVSITTKRDQEERTVEDIANSMEKMMQNLELTRKKESYLGSSLMVTGPLSDAGCSVEREMDQNSDV